MAKVKGPLMSMEASGSYGGALVFGRRLGANVVRQLVTPANPMSAGQEVARNRVRVFGALQKFARATGLKYPSQTKRDVERIAGVCPSGQRWNSYLEQAGIGKGGTVYDAAHTAYGLLTSPQKSAWDAAAGALVPAIGSVSQKEAGGVAGTPVSAGEAFYIYVYALAQMGLASTPSGTPPTYA